jgi:predicted transcriptional regulator
MTKITVDIDEDVLARMNELARARNLSVEDLLKEQIDGMVKPASFTLENKSHLAIVEALANQNLGWREEAYDRAKGRAEDYLENRKRLMELARSTQGDMGAEGWDRRRAYDP